MVIALSGFFISCATPAVSRPTIAIRRDSSTSCAGFRPSGTAARSCALTWSNTSPSSRNSASSRRSSVAPRSPRAEPRQAAANHVHRPQHDLREQHRGSDRDQQRDAGGDGGRRQRSIQIALHQERRQADADLAERRVAERHRLGPLEIRRRRRRSRAAASTPFIAIRSFNCGRRAMRLADLADRSRRSRCRSDRRSTASSASGE